ncbi:MAG: hypothetical protein VCA37_16615 [Roseibacillus sp.]
MLNFARHLLLIPLLMTITLSGVLQAEEVTKLLPVSREQPQLRRLPVPSPPKDGVLQLRGPLPSIIRIWIEGDKKRTPLEFGFNKDATLITVYLPDNQSAVAALRFLITGKTATHPDGTVVLSALDSEVVGQKAKLETHPGSHRIGFWGRAEDFVRWHAKIPAGEYDVDLVYSRASRTGTIVSIEIDGSALPLTLETTGSWYRYRELRLGTVSVREMTKHLVETRVTRIVNGGVMNLKAIVLTPRRKQE